MSRKLRLGLLILLTILFTTGCLYPQDRLTGGMEALPRHVEEVQQAVDRFQKQKSVLPIKTVEADTPVYRKYAIDFERLTPAYIGDAPPSAFEKGGNFMYVLINVEDDPTVKVFDLRVTEKVRDVQLEINEYTREHERYPRGFEISPGVFELNKEQLQNADVKIPSPYHPENMLPLVMSSDGTVYVDYRTDLMRIIEDMDTKPESGTDIRALLTEDSLFVPAHSLPYRYENGDAVFDVKP